MIAGLLSLFGLLLIAAALISPVFAIWALNTLFDLAIPVTLRTYATAALLGPLVYGALLGTLGTLVYGAVAKK